MRQLARSPDGAQRNPGPTARQSWITLALHPGFCNGPWLVNPFLRYPLAGHLLLYGIGARPSPDGVHEEPVGQSTDCVVVNHFPDVGLTGSIVPAKGLRSGRAW